MCIQMKNKLEEKIVFYLSIDLMTFCTDLVKDMNEEHLYWRPKLIIIITKIQGNLL